jgi:hypothetical protein
MEPMITKTRITIETESTVLVRQGRTVMTWCPDCQAEVEVLLLSDGSSTAQLLSPLGSAALHVWTSNDGETRVCLPSLLACNRPNDVTRTVTPERTLPAPGRSLTTEGE